MKNSLKSVQTVTSAISQSTKSKDYVRKLDLYMSCGVCEYWIVDPDNRQVQIYLFKEKDILNNKTFSFNDDIKSFYFEGLAVNLRDYKPAAIKTQEHRASVFLAGFATQMAINKKNQGEISSALTL